MRRMALRLFTLMLTPLLFSTPSIDPHQPVDTDQNPWLDRRVLNIAHQGGEFEAPSNTLFAAKTAVRTGADMLEFDVRATIDGQLVVLHDETVDRTTNGSGRIDQLSLRQVRELDAAHWFVPDCGTCHDHADADYPYRGFATGERPIPPELDEFEPRDFRVPSVREILRAFPNVLLNFEMKATEPDVEPYEKELAELLVEYGRSTDTIVVSFDGDAIERFKPYAPLVSTAPGTGAIVAFWLSSQGPFSGKRIPGMHALQVPTELNGLDILTADFVDDAHANELAVHVWTINDRAEMERLVELGVDGIMTNRPTVLADVLADAERS